MRIFLLDMKRDNQSVGLWLVESTSSSISRNVNSKRATNVRLGKQTRSQSAYLLKHLAIIFDDLECLFHEL